VAARVWFGSSWRDVRFGDRENFPAAAQAVALFRSGGNKLGLGAALWRAGSALLTAETAAEAAAYFTEAEQVLRGHGPTKWLALCMVKQGDLRFRLGALDAALAAYEEAMQLTRTTGNWYGLMNGGSNMAELLFHMGQRDAALAQLRQLRDELLPGRRTPLVATMVAHLLLAGQTREARLLAREAVVYARAVGLPAALAWTVEALALLLVEEGALDEAGRLAGYARGVHPSVATRAGSRRAVFQLLDKRLSQGLAPSRRVRLAAEGQSWTEAAAAEAALEASRAVA
jgi:tetratricopeptide (TPR) repeat protein